MDGLELLDELEEVIAQGASVPFSGRCILERDELMDIVQDLKLKLPDDLKQAKWIKEDRQRILNEAQTEADDIIKAANEKGISMINEHEITQQAMEQARQIIDKAKAEAKEIIDSSYNYADRLLETVEKVSVSSMKELEQCISIVRSNRSELRNSDNATVVNEEPPTEEAE
ncbi:MAG: ATPase [Clostridiales bacterium]|nr:ATPase [Clostridiales bacterium]